MSGGILDRIWSFPISEVCYLVQREVSLYVRLVQCLPERCLGSLTPYNSAGRRRICLYHHALRADRLARSQWPSEEDVLWLELTVSGFLEAAQPGPSSLASLAQKTSVMMHDYDTDQTIGMKTSSCHCVGLPREPLASRLESF